jgi:UDP:flavonoid glycosyltransferase YjiC (YdhE family)
MHALVIAIGSHGDVHPMLGIATALRDRGHRVTFVASGYFEALARGAGFDDFVALGTAEEFRKQLGNPDLWHPMRAFKAVFLDNVFPATRAMYDAVVERALPGETIVVAHTLALGARLAQEKHGIPTVSVHLSPSVFRSVHELPRLGGSPFRTWMPVPVKRLFWKIADTLFIEPALGGPMNAIRAELGLGPIRGLIDTWWHSPLLTLGLFPSWFAAVQPDWPKSVRLTTFPLYDERGVTPMSDPLKKFLDAGDPPIAFTPGSAMTFGRAFFEASAKACHRIGKRGLLLTRHGEQIPPNLPPGVIHVDYAPFSELLPRCAALVHHGGIGTTAQALAAGVPQLVMPLAHDQFDNADRVRRLGVGTWITLRRYSARAAAAKLNALLTDKRVADACRQVAARFVGVDAMAQTCELIEQVHASRVDRARSGSSLIAQTPA